MDSNDEDGEVDILQHPNTDMMLQRAMNDYENQMSMHKNIQDANLQHNSAKVQSIQQKDMVRDQINLYLKHTNNALAYLQTEKKESESRKSLVPSTEGPGEDEPQLRKQKENEEKQKELFTKNQSIIDNFAKFEDDLHQFDAELTNMMINPIAEPGLYSSGSSGKAWSHKEDIDIDKLLEDLKKQGEEMLSKQQKMKDGSGQQKQDQID